MTEDTDECASPIALLADLVRLCKRDGLVRELADALHLTRQTVYLWEKTDESSLTFRTAKLRLLEVSRLAIPKLAPIAVFAAWAVACVEANEMDNRGVQ